jgi:hypothetical protein
MMKSRIPKPTSGHLDRSFFLVSRGRVRISTLRCPEVGLGIPDLTSGHLGIEGRLSGER